MVYEYYWVKLSETGDYLEIFDLFKQRFRKAVFLASLPITIRFSTFETECHYVAQSSLKLLATLSPQLSKY